MRLLIIIASIFFCTVCSLNLDDIKFVIDYFKYRNIRMICIFTCGKDVSWSVKFSKLANNDLMSVSTVVLDDRVTWDRSFYNCLHSKLHSTGVLLDGQCEATEEAMSLASKNLSFSTQHKWLIIKNDTAFYDHSSVKNLEDNMTMKYCYKDSVFNILEELSISVDADIVVTARNESEYYSLYEVYNIGKIQGGDLIVKETGNWDVTNGLNLKYDLNEYKYYRRWDFNQWKMRMILVMFPAPKIFDSSLLAEISTVPGMAKITQTGAALLNLIAEIHNFGFNYTITDRWIGSFDKNATKVVTNSLYFEEQDISPVIRYLPSISDKIDVSPVSVQTIETKFYYRIPTTGTGKFENKFLTPLSPVAWWGVIGTSALCASSLMLSARLEQRSSTIQYAIFSVIALICQQFYEDNDDDRVRRNLIARKMLILISGLSCVLIYNYYTSSVVSWLLNAPPPSINSLWELLESPLQLVFEDVGYTRSWLQTPTFYFNKRNAKVEDQLRKRKVFNKKKNDPLFKSLKDGIKMVQLGGYAYHTEVNSANELISRTFSQSELCELGSLQVMDKTPLFTCIPKNSPYKEFITWSLISVFERGFVSCLRARTDSPEVKCEGSSPRALALGGAAPAFMLLAAGYLLATGIMLIERAAFKLKSK